MRKKQYKKTDKGPSPVRFFAIAFFLIVFLLVSFNSFSAERDLNKEQKLGKKLSEDIEKKYEVVEDSQKNLLIRQIGNKLAKVSELKGMNYHFRILKKEGPNAF